MAIHSKWYPPKLRNASTKEKEQFEASIRASTTALKRLKQIIIDKCFSFSSKADR